MAALCLLLVNSPQGYGWSNRGHRLVNLIAAQSLPDSMPLFMRTPDAVREISYLGPEPDRWRPPTEPELSAAAGSDHAFRVEMGEMIGELPRRRLDFYRELEQLQAKRPAGGESLTPQGVGTLPWQAEEIFERLQAAFRAFRIVQGEFPGTYEDITPMSKADLPDIEASARFYAGWLGHYIGDGCQPLHATVNVAGWILKGNPNGYNTKGEIHHRLELVVDNMIESGGLQPRDIQRLVTPPRVLQDPFVDTLTYLKMENEHAEEVYKLDKKGAIAGLGTPEMRQFVARRMGEGSSMLRDLIYTAWIDSNRTVAPNVPPVVIMKP